MVLPYSKREKGKKEKEKRKKKSRDRAVGLKRVVGKIAERTSDIFADFSSDQIGLHANYWFDYEKYIRELGHEAKTIEDMKSSIQARVGIARNNGDAIVDRVEEWLKEVGLKLEALRPILEVGATAATAMVSCFVTASPRSKGRSGEGGG